MAKIIGAIASSHTPTIGFGYGAWPPSPARTADTVKRLNLQPDWRP